MAKQSLSQHLGAFKGPYLSDFMVQNVDDLENINYKYKHKICWVIEKACWYYRFDDTVSNGWKAVSTPARIQEWNSSQQYVAGETVYYKNENDNNPGKGIYVAGLNTTPGTSPTGDPENWICISDDSRVITLEFTSQTEITWEVPVGKDILATVYELDADTKTYHEVQVEVKCRKNDTLDKWLYSCEFFSGYDENNNPIPYNFTGIIKMMA